METIQLKSLVYALGRLGPNGVNPLGTACLLNQAGRLATVAHVTGGDDQNLVVLVKELASINDFQDTSDKEAHIVPANIIAIDPISDLCVLEIDSDAKSSLTISSVDALSVGQQITILGYPHANHGRLVLTYQQTEVGARILISNQGIKVKNIVLNIQARPGQSGSPVFAGNPPGLLAFLVGAYVPGSSAGAISLGGIDPQTLHQTTHAVSAEYLVDML